MTEWLAFSAIVAFISLLGWLAWDDIGSWYTHQPRECIGCGKGLMKPGCRVHDPQERKIAA